MVAVGGHVSAWWSQWVGLAVVWGVVVAARRRSMMVQQPLVMEARVGMEGQQTLVMMARFGMVGQQALVMVAIVWWWRRGFVWRDSRRLVVEARVCMVGRFACGGGGQHSNTGGEVVKLHRADGGATFEASRPVVLAATFSSG